MRDNTPMTRAIDEHLALALPGWGAPGGRFVRSKIRRHNGPLRSAERALVEDDLRRQSELTLRSILVPDVARKYGIAYATAQRALNAVLSTPRSLAA